MASVNPFDLLGDDDTDDVSQLIAKAALAAPISAPPSQQQQPKQAKLPSKPTPPAQAVRESKTEGRGGGRGGGRGEFGRGRGAGGRGGFNRDGAGGGGGFNRDGAGGGGGFNRDGAGGGGGFNRDGAGFNRDGAGYNRDGTGYNRDGAGYNRDRVNNENAFSNNGISGGYGPTEDGEVEKFSGARGGYGGARGSSRGGRRGGFNNGEVDGERPKRVFERRSGTGRSNDLKREGSGKGNWGSTNDEIVQDTEELGNANEKNLTPEKQPEEEITADASKETPVNEPEEKEPEEKEMTLDEYQKVLEEKRKALLALKVEERKVPVDKEFESMQQLSGKKTNHDVFIKLGSDKDKKKEIADKDEKAKKSVSINEFLKPAGGEKYYSPGGRGRGRGRGGRGGAVYSGGSNTSMAAPSIEDPGEFPNLK